MALYLDKYLGIVEGSFENIFDTRDSEHFLRPYFGSPSFERFRHYLNTIYNEYNYRVYTNRLFDLSIRASGLLMLLYEDVEFTKQYAYLYPFISIEGDTCTVPKFDTSSATVIPERFICFNDFMEITEADLVHIKEVLKKADEHINLMSEATIDYLRCYPCTASKWIDFLRSDFFINRGDEKISAPEFSNYPLNYKITGDVISGVTVEESTEQAVPRNLLYKTFNYTYPVKRIFGHSVQRYKKTRKKGKKPEVKYSAKGPSYGIELELACSHTEKYLIDAQEKPFFMLKSDASITGDGGYYCELVTRPMDYRSQRVAWGKWFSNIWDKEKKEYTGFDCSKTTDNGMHVHIGQDCFHSRSHSRNFLWFLIDPSNHEFLRFLSERGKKMSEYCQFPRCFSKSRKSDFLNAGTLVYGEGGRGAVYPSNKETYEIRIFKGIVSYATVLKNLEFVDSLYYYTQRCPYSKLTVTDYINWLTKETPKNKYKTLKHFLKLVPSDLLAKSTLFTVFHGCLTAKDALNVIEKKQIGPDQNVLVFLNKRHSHKGKKAFIIKDGKYILNPDNYAMLKDLDAEINPWPKTQSIPAVETPLTTEQESAGSISQFTISDRLARSLYENFPRAA